jgi:hypothetical protein
VAKKSLQSLHELLNEAGHHWFRLAILATHETEAGSQFQSAWANGLLDPHLNGKSWMWWFMPIISATVLCTKQEDHTPEHPVQKSKSLSQKPIREKGARGIS